MIIIGTFRTDIQDTIEKRLTKYNDKYRVKLLNKKDGILHSVQDELVDINTLFTTHLTEEELRLLPNLKTIIVPMTGLDGIDESIVDSGDIQVLNAHSAAPYIAERGMGILMTLAGKIDKQSYEMKQGQWNGRNESEEWFSLRDKKIGIYGYGHIGKAFEKMMRPFTANIYTINRHKNYPKDINLVNDLNELTKISDVLFIAVPGNSTTKDTIGETELANLKDGLIVNVGRGKVVNQKALFNALENHSIKGYGSDVWYNYPKNNDKICQASDEDLGKFDHIVMTPHNAWNNDHKEELVMNEMMEHLKTLI